ncbi:MAG: hypothetical protein ACYDH4_00915 [Candidatus Cryosericum sp.]
MDPVVAQGLRISGLSYVLIFAVLGIFYGLIKLLLRILPRKDDST